MRRLSRRGLLAAFVMLGAPAGAAAQLDVVTTTAEVAAIVRTLGGPLVRADSLTSGASDAHFAAAKPSMIRRARDARLLIAIGAELEEGWLPALLPAAGNPRIQPGQPGFLDLSSRMALLRDFPDGASAAQGHVHKAGNPHYMLDPRNGVIAARAIAAKLAELDPANAAAYRGNLAGFERDFAAKWMEWQRGFAPLKGQAVVTYHQSLTYLAQAFGFFVVGEVEPLPGISPTAAHLERLSETIRRQRVRLLLIEAFYERRSAAFLAERTGVKVAVIPHSVDAAAGMRSYFDLFDRILASIRQAGAL